MRLRSQIWLLGATALLSVAPTVAQEAPEAEANAPLFGGDSNPEIVVLGKQDPFVRKATAMVNGAVITDTDVDQRLNLVVTANGGKIEAEERERLRLQVLRNLIDEKLQIAEAGEHDVKIEPAEVNSAFTRVASNFKQSPKQFTIYLKERETSAASLKQQIQAELAWSRLLRRRVEPFVNVGDDEVEAVITKLEASKGQTQYRVGEIFLEATTENEQQVIAGAQRIVDQVRGGASFIAYARQFSQASTAAVGGDLGLVQPEQLDARLAEALKTMQKGDYSDPIRTATGVTILHLVDKKQILAADPDAVTLALKQISISFKPGADEKAAGELVKALQAKTQAMGGCGRADDVGRELGADVVANDAVQLKNLPAALQSMMRNMRVGEATPPFGSRKDGVRVLVLCGRDDSTVQEVKGPSKDEVYAQMNDERVNRAARRYLRDLRRDAIVDYR